MKATLTKCKNQECEEMIDAQEYECDFCEDCCYEDQMSWQKKEVDA